MRLAKRAEAISPSSTLAIAAKAKEMKKAGIDVIAFGVGEPDFDTPLAIKQAGMKAIADGFTKYMPVGGADDFKAAIVAKLKRDNDLIYQPDEIIVSSGAKHSLYNAFQVLCEVGDEVIVPTPCWVSYCEQIKLAGGIPVFAEGREENGFKLCPEDLKAVITPQSRIIVLTSPSNPTGAVYSKAELEALAEVILEHKLWVISDEIYEKLVYDGNKHISFASLSEEAKKATIVINGLSKGYAMTGWRIGYAAGPKEVIKAMNKLQSHMTSNAASMAQKAGVEALSGDQTAAEEMRQEFEKRRNYMVERLNKMPGIKCCKPGGAFYVFPNVREFFGKSIGGNKINNSSDLANVLLTEARVALVPGSAFSAEGYLRISYANSLEQIKEGLDRIEQALSRAE